MYIKIPENQRNRTDLQSWVKQNIVNGEYVSAMCRECGLVLFDIHALTDDAIVVNSCEEHLIQKGNKLRKIDKGVIVERNF